MSSSKRVKIKGEVLTLEEWAKRFEVTFKILLERIRRWGLQEAMRRSFDQPGIWDHTERRAGTIEYQGESLSVAEWAERCKLSESAMATRIQTMGGEAIRKSLEELTADNPAEVRRSRSVRLEVFGRSFTYRELAEFLGCSSTILFKWSSESQTSEEFEERIRAWARRKRKNIPEIGVVNGASQMPSVVDYEYPFGRRTHRVSVRTDVIVLIVDKETRTVPWDGTSTPEGRYARVGTRSDGEPMLFLPVLSVLLKQAEDRDAVIGALEARADVAKVERISFSDRLLSVHLSTPKIFESIQSIASDAQFGKRLERVEPTRGESIGPRS